MSSSLYTNLEWLPPAPEDFGLRCKQLQNSATVEAADLRALAGYRLDVNQLSRLARVVAALKERNAAPKSLLAFRLGILSNATSDFSRPAIVASALRYGLLVDVVSPGYGQMLQSALDPFSNIHTNPCDAVLLAVDYRGLPMSVDRPGDAGAAEARVDAAIADVKTICEGIRKNSRAACIMQTIARPVETLFGNADRTVPGTWVYLVERFNRRLSESLSAGDVLVDVASIAETVGLANWHEPTQWNLAKLPFALSCLPLYADHVCRVIGAMRGKSRRVLALDLDNTLWSGVIGDDGVEGIIIGQGDATGEAHLSLQESVLALRGRGVVLAVSSKNDDEVARSPFRKHPDMLLHEEHFNVFQANWQDKASNLHAIAQALNLGDDALVFVDDNPFERNLVRQNLPAVTVPELPDDPAYFARTLAAAGYFESVAFSVEDRSRADFYQNNAQRVALQEQMGSVETYLESLAMEITFASFDAVGRSRIAQLINKSNQFNLTTRRYTEAQIQAMETDDSLFTLQVRLRDRFGDNGMISVVICRDAGEAWEIDTWLMSCRVLGRRVEQAVLSEVLEQARARSVKRLVGHYVPTERNELVRDHYAQLGFELKESLPSGETVWTMATDHIVPKAIPMAVVRIG
jgi:FkbH-like protein